MSAYTGPTPEILAAVTIPDTNTNAMTAFRALGNSVRLRVTTTGGSCTSLTFTAEVSKDGTTYYDVIDRDSVWSFVSTVPNTAGAYDVEMEGLAVVPGEMVRLSYKAAAKAGTLAVTAICWENPKGGGTSISVGDVVVDTDTMVSLLTTIDADTSIIASGSPGSGYKSYIDAAFVTGSSPATHDINTDLTRNATQGFIANDGTGNISIKISESGAVTGEDAIVVEDGDILSLDGYNIDQLQVTWVADTAYRVVVK